MSAEASAEVSPTEIILGVSFFHGTAASAAQRATEQSGCVVIPASPALVKLNYDEGYRSALQHADLVLPDSELLVLLWRIATGRTLAKISGIDYLTTLLCHDSFRKPSSTLWIVSSDTAKERAIQWLQSSGQDVGRQTFRVVPTEAASSVHHALLLEIEALRPRHVMIALRGGGQEQLGTYLRDYLLYRPAIHCVGAALGFLTGDERRIPTWARKHRLGWLIRLGSQPHMLLPRFLIALSLSWMVIRSRAKLPPLKARWTDL